MGTGTTTRRSAAERREEIIAAAIPHFARSGYAAASTDAIARDAGLSQPYLFRLFGTKRDLFLACHARMHERILATFRAAAQGRPVAERMPAMGAAYGALLADRDALLFQMQSYAACADPGIREQVRGRYVELVRDVQGLTEAEPAVLRAFFATGMLLNVAASLELEVVAGEEAWVQSWWDPERLAMAPPGAGPR